MCAASAFSWPTGHGSWFFSELAEYEASAATFLAEGVRRGERVMFVADEPGASRWPEHLVKDGVRVLGSLNDVYGPLRDGDPGAQRSVFAAAVDEALQEGFTGIRVVADNTQMVNENFERWMEWESIADAFIAANPVTGLCGFDRSRLALDEVHSLMLVHRRSVAD